jgi:hypothetical protein
VSPVKYELGFYMPEDNFLQSHGRVINFLARVLEFPSVIMEGQLSSASYYFPQVEKCNCGFRFAPPPPTPN